MTKPTLFWHDYETSGIDPQRDRPIQFAGVRTDYEFNIIDAPVVIYCKPALDMLPHPQASLVTGITPQIAQQKGVHEAEFMALIHEQLARPATCTLGYNNLRFDDEVTRNGLYRNFYDPYSREWQYGNSRWDLIDVLRAARALRPEGVEWVVNEQGEPSFRLDQLTLANNIPHEAAHDALGDVYATIAMAKLVQRAQPKLYEFLWQHRTKTKVSELLAVGSFKPVVHVSGMFAASKSCLAIVLPICLHPSNTNGVIVYDLSVDPTPLLSLSAADIQARLFTATADLAEGVSRIPLKTVHINKCPVVAPLAVIRPEDAKRLNLDMASCLENVDKIKAAMDLSAKLVEVFASSDYGAVNVDPDLAIYSGGFFAESDKALLFKIRNMTAEQLVKANFNFSDSRLPEMLFRYRARNYPHTLSVDEYANWCAWCIKLLTSKQAGTSITFEQYFSELQTLRDAGQSDASIIDALMDYGREKMQQLDLPSA